MMRRLALKEGHILNTGYFSMQNSEGARNQTGTQVMHTAVAEPYHPHYVEGTSNKHTNATEDKPL